ncbi:MAG: serine hydrolase domain-containing protein [Erysipelotrichaceae bacterium]|nr:serine hydrolase domain-containing protein [Erysipelotrichaceae bacterium]
MHNLLTEIQNKIDAYVSDNKLPSITVGIVDKQQYYQCQSGYQQVVPTKLGLQQNAIYDLASLSKVTATLLMILKLLEDGNITLDDRVCKYLPEFRYSDVTILNLLVHTSGLAADDKNYRLCHDKNEMTAFLYQLTQLHPTGSKVVYSCFNYILLGFIIEQLKSDMESYSKQVIFDPLNMKYTGYNPNKKGWKERCVATEVTAERGVIKGEVHDGKAYLLGGVAGNAGVFSTADDLSHLAMMLLNGGLYHGKTVFKPSTIALLRNCYTEGLNERRSLGWFFSDPYCQFAREEVKECLYHTGFTGTSMYIDYDHDCSIIILTNRIHPTRENAYIMDIRKELHGMIINSFIK